MKAWYVVEEQTHNDMGWIHPAKRVRTSSVVMIPDNYKYERSALRYISKSESKIVTCKQLWKINYPDGKKKADKISDQTYPGFYGDIWESDQHCRAHHRPHVIGTKPKYEVRPGWRIEFVTQDESRVRRWLGAQSAQE